MKALLLWILLWPAALLAQAGPDERILWQLFHAHKYRLLKQAIAEYQNKYPNWQPPAELTRLLSRAKSQTLTWQINDALRRRDSTRLLKLVRQYPNAFGCRRTEALSALAHVYARRGQKEKALAWYRKALRCPTVQPADLLAEALWQLSPSGFSALLEAAKPKLAPAAFLDLAYQNARRKLLAESQNPTWSPKEIAPTLLHQASARHDLDLIAALAWAWFRHGAFDQARLWFEAGLALAPYDRNMATGLLQSLIRLGEDEHQVLSLGQRFPFLREEAAGHLLARAWEHYRRGNFPTSQKLAEQAAKWLPQAEDARYLLGWLAFKRGDYESSRHTFLALWQTHPDREDYARALVASHLQAGEPPERLLERFPHRAIQKEVSPYLAKRSFAHKQFLRAYLLDPKAFPELERLLAPAWGAGGMARYRSGSAGLDRLRMTIAPWYEGNYSFAEHRLSLNLGRIELDSDRLSSSGIGALQASKHPLTEAQRAALAQESLQLARRLPPHTIEAAWLELAYRHEGRLNPYVQLGLTPIGAELAPSPTACLGIGSWSDGATWQWRWQVEAYRQPIRQSLLSYTGWKLAGQRWGRVLRNGAKLSGLGIIGPLALYQSLEGAFIDGQSTQDNWMVGYVLAAGYNLSWPGLDYFSIGPYFHFMHYANNQNHFRPSHGGYFSPRAFYSGGMQLALRSEEGKRFLLESRLALGVQHFREQAADWFPESCDALPLCGLKFPNNRQTSFAPSAELRFAWQLHPQLQLVGGIYARQTQGWREAGGGILLRVLFAPTKSAISADLPEPLFAGLE